MPRSIRTALAAAAPHAVRMQILCALSAADVELLQMADNGPDALQALSALRPDLLIVDAQLPGMEGASLVLRAMENGRLSLRPVAILLHDGCYPLPQRAALEEAGVLLLEKPFTPAQFAKVMQLLRESDPTFPGADVRRADALLDALGFPEHRGRQCLRTAALLCAADARHLHALNASLYPQIGRMLQLNAAQVERSMRHAINLAWRSEQIETQNRIFADTVDAGRGQPTCGEMISRLADILRSEG